MTHSALSSSSCGIESGMPKISFSTVAAFARRSLSFSVCCADTTPVIDTTLATTHRGDKMLQLHVCSFKQCWLIRIPRMRHLTVIS